MTSPNWARRFVFSTTLLALLIALLPGTMLAQGSTSTIRGIVTDPQGAVIPNANVTITNPSTGYTRSMKSGPGGNYSFDQIPIGEYRVEVSAPNFKKGVIQNVRALVAKATDANLTLQVGATAETVEVTAQGAEALVNTQDASLGNNIQSVQIAQLPLEARNVAALLTLQPGVTRGAEVAGARSDQSNVTLDGVDINESQTNAVAGAGSTATAAAEQGPVLRLNSEAVEEFRVTTMTPNATGGRGSAAQIAVVTKSGTNSFHGAAFESYRSKGFSANDWFNNHATPAVPRRNLIRHTFGGAFGGPIIRNRAFFFYNYEGRRDASASSVVRVVPLPTLGQGIVRYPSPSGSITTLTSAQIAQIFPAVGTNPAAVSAMAALANKYKANDFTVGDSTSTLALNTAGFRFNAPTPVKLNGHIGRVDLNLSNSQNLFIRANVYHDHRQNSPQFPDTPAPGEWDHPFGLGVGHTWTIHNNLVNNFRYGVTRQAFTTLGDSKANNISLRFILLPLQYNRDFSRTNPVQNFVDDVSWIKGTHTLQFGFSGTLISNGRVSFGNAYDTAVANPSFYPTGAIRNPVNAFSPIGSGFGAATENAVNAIIGRYSQYTARFTFDHDGKLLPSGTATERNFKNWGVEQYIQDVWKMRPNLTLTVGLRYSLWRPVYEEKGFETKPNIPLGTYFDRRVAAAKTGKPFFDPITVNLSGPANHTSPMYTWDKTNFQPRVAIAWSPEFLPLLFGHNHASVLRGGFSMSGDYFGQAVAAFFDTNNTLGFGSNTTIAANTFNVTTRPAPAFTGYNQDIRTLPRITVPTGLTFPQQKPADGAPRIEASLDENLQTPKSYAWSATFERQFRGGLVFQGSYMGRLGRHLLLQRDVMAINNLVDPKSGVDWYTAATILEKLRHNGASPDAAVAPVPYFENIFPANLRNMMTDYYGLDSVCSAAAAATGDCIPNNFSPTQTIFWIANNFYGNDWTTTQDDLDEMVPQLAQHLFYQPQYGALTAFSSVGNSTYHAFALSLRERFKNDITVDFNYTLGHSLDDASGLQTSGSYGAAFLLNPIRQRDNYANSDFDVRQLINVSSIVQLPFGKGKMLFGNAGGALNAIIGGWQITDVFRWNTGLPISAPYDDARWATNWNVQSSATRVAPVSQCPTRPIVGSPKLFGCNVDKVYQSFRNAYPGETGERNTFRMPGYVALDAGLGKSFPMPIEGHTLQFRWEVFNVTNTQRFGTIDVSRTGYGIVLDPNRSKAPTNWSNFTGIQGAPRVMQFALRYGF